MNHRLTQILVLAACLCPVLGLQAQETISPIMDLAVTNDAPRTKPVKTPGNAFFASGGTNDAGGMTIVSDQLEFDYRDLVVAFDGHVHVTDPQFTMTSDRMLVFLQGTNEIKRIIALGSVDIVQPPDRHATCEKAVYEHGSGQVVMTGTPVLIRGADRVTGEEVIIWLADQRVVVKKGNMQIGSDTMKNRTFKP